MVACVLDDLLPPALRLLLSLQLALLTALLCCLATAMAVADAYVYTTHRVTDVYVCSVGQVCHCRVQVDDVPWQLVLVQVGVDALNQGGLARSSHT
jgi:hypothetical protein